jgi:membrane-associated phospholipid phosphatase
MSLIITGAARRWGILVALAGVLVAWVRIYLGLNYPDAIASSAVIGMAFSLLASSLEPLVRRHVVPAANRLYDSALNALRIPRALFPRTPERR